MVGFGIGRGGKCGGGRRRAAGEVGEGWLEQNGVVFEVIVGVEAFEVGVGGDVVEEEGEESDEVEESVASRGEEERGSWSGH
ncbi:hypothetical protein Hanom_Chr06g00535851 [Helianthus anomalus]